VGTEKLDGLIQGIDGLSGKRRDGKVFLFLEVVLNHVDNQQSGNFNIHAMVHGLLPLKLNEINE